MSRKPKQYYIKERYNPQLGTYYVLMGQLSKTAAKSYERPLYGDNVMLGFDTELEYNAKITELKQQGQPVQ